MNLLKSIYQSILENDFKSFCKMYERTNLPSMYLFHDKLIVTAYVNQDLPLSDIRYQNFIDFLLNKASTPQIVALLVYQNNPLASKYWSKSNIINTTENINILVHAAIKGNNKKAIIDLAKNEFEKVLNLVLQSDYKEAKLSLIDLIFDNDKNIKLVLGTFIQLVRASLDIDKFDYDPYIQFLERYPINGKKFLETYSKKIDNVKDNFSKIFSLARFMGRDEDLLIINAMTSNINFKKPEWYSVFFHPLSQNVLTQENEKLVESMYFNLLLHIELKEKPIRNLVIKI